MSDLSQYVEMYRHFAELDTDVLWQKVSVIRDAIADGADKDTLLAECGKESGDSRKQVAKFYAVAMVFKAGDIFKDFDYWTHEVAATAPGVDTEDRPTHVIAREWMRNAAEGYETTRTYKNGRTKTTTRKHTARTLRRLIAGKPENVKPVVVYRGEALYHGYKIWSWKTELTLSILDGINPVLEDLEWGETVTVTITCTPPATVSESESEVAA